VAEPKAFISYSHDSPAHKAWVLKLATDLRANGVDATLDQWDLSPGQDLVAYMHHGITTSDRVLLVCSHLYVQKAEQGSGGVGYERLVLTAELVQNIDTRKFVPLVRDNNAKAKVPTFLGPRLYIDFSKDTEYETKLEELLRELLGIPSSVKPPLGPNPFSGSAPPVTSLARGVGPTGITPSGQPLLDDEWFQNQAAHAIETVVKQKLNAHMELRFAVHAGLNKSQIELLNAVRKSEIRTFGWPIGVTLENRDEYRPRPFENGIRAEVTITEHGLSGTPSYDYWALRSSGDFYLLQSLFEDQRAENKIFFNTRIVRVTEALLFAANLYNNLGAAPEARLSVRVTHRGLKGRELTSSSLNRDILPGTANEHQSQTEIVVELGRIRETLVDDVQRLTAPMFMLFDFKEFSLQVYTDIVRRFEKGDVS
jgi:hypothetical protein